VTAPVRPAIRDLLPTVLIYAIVAVALAAGVSRLEPPDTTLLDRFPPLADDEEAILFAGDTLLTGGSAIRARMKEHGSDWMFRHLEGLVESADAVALVSNLEGPVTKHRKKGAGVGKWHYAMKPKRVDGLHAAGITHVSLANNHALDRRLEGLEDTWKHLDKAGIVHFGTGPDLAAAREPAIIVAGGARVAVLGGMEPWRMKREADWGATDDRPGVLLFDKTGIAPAVAHARSRADLVVAFPHWGGNYSGVGGSQHRIAERLQKAGVDAIIGHHGHAAQEFGWEGDVPVLFGLGNFQFGTPGRFGHDKKQPGYGLLARMVLSGGAIRRIELVPIRINNRLQNYQPKPCQRTEARQVLDAFAARGGADIRYVDGVGVIDVPKEASPAEASH